MQVLLGADPEVFVMSQTRPVPAYNMIPGTKKDPFPVKHGAVQVDGLALEFNIDPAKTEDEFVFNIREVMAQLMGMVPDPNLICFQSSINFHNEDLKGLPEIALELGCDPDWNAWTEEVNPEPEAHVPTFRTAAGHLHVGWCTDADIEDPVHISGCFSLVKQMDILLGIPSRLETNDVERRKLYGMPGAFRPKTYGLEYRVLSNYWIRDEEMMRLVYKRSRLAVELLVEGHHLYEAYDREEVVDLMTTSHEDAVARHWMDIQATVKGLGYEIL